MNPHYPHVAARAGHRCEYCHAPEVIFNFPFEIEHIVPPGIGGQSEMSNLALACRACNLLKSAHLTGVDELTRVEAPLFHPRNDTWNDHFRVDPATMSILGTTQIGRATVNRLQMNRATSLAARQQWVRLGLFP